MKDDIPLITSYTVILREIASFLEPSRELTLEQRQAAFGAKAETLQQDTDPILVQFGSTMTRWQDHLFADFEALGIPVDNLDLERYFKLPKHMERKISGGIRVTSRLVREGETLIPALDAHIDHPQPFTPVELLPYAYAPVPSGQSETARRHSIKRQARSDKMRPKLLVDLEARYNDGIPLRTLPPPKDSQAPSRWPDPPRHPLRTTVLLKTSKQLGIPVVTIRNPPVQPSPIDYS